METLLQIKCLFKKICCNMALVMISSYFAFLVEGNATPDEIDMLWVSEHVSVGYFRIPNSIPCLPPSPPPPSFPFKFLHKLLISGALRNIQSENRS